jgi:prepilin-type N-terminal cleavage/methylation domain-containing protein
MKDNFKKINKKTMSICFDSVRRINRRGFSLVEVMLVIFILSTALTVFIQVISKGIVHSIESQDSIIAAGLVQEGIELAKNKRDDNLLKKRAAFTDIDTDGDYQVDYNEDISPGGPVVPLGIDNNGYYTASGTTEETKFSRKITIETIADAKEVVSYVVWSRLDFPENISECKISNRCVYAIITLTKWGEQI